MEFAFTEEHERWREVAREFAQGPVAAAVPEMEATDEMPPQLIRSMADLGLIGHLVPQRYGGTEAGFIARASVIEEIAKVSAAAALSLVVCQLGISPIERSGSEEQKRRLLPPLARGERLVTFGGTEDIGGCDFANSRATATPNGTGYVLSGRKVYITNSHLSDLAVVVARTGGDGASGLSAFVARRGPNGFCAGAKDDRFGLRGCNTGELVLEGCHVAVEDRLGDEGQGVPAVLDDCSRAGRSGIAVIGLGVLTASLEMAAEYARERVLDGRPIAHLQAVQWPLAEMWTEREAARLLCYRAAWLLDTGQRFDAEVAAAKYMATEGAVRAAKRAIDIVGARGYLRDHPAQRFYRDAQCLIAPGATSEMMRATIANRVLSS